MLCILFSFKIKAIKQINYLFYRFDFFVFAYVFSQCNGFLKYKKTGVNPNNKRRKNDMKWKLDLKKEV